MAEDLMRYDLLTLDALRGVVRRALQRVMRSGLPGEHHFYISFDTRHAGVVISERLRQKHAENMTIVIQHQFWNLSVDKNVFTVELSFNDIPERLVVPFAAIKAFSDPYAQFALQFELAEPPAGQKPQPAPPQPAQSTPAETARLPAPKPPGTVAEAPAQKDENVVVLDKFRKK
jgi:hypothetical protein